MRGRRPRLGSEWLAACLAVAFFADGALCQSPVVVRRPSSSRNDASANRFVTFLELPQRRTQGARGLLTIGAAAVPALLRGARHPDPAVAMACLQILGELGSDAQTAKESLEQLAAAKEGATAYAAAWALTRLDNDGTIFIADYTVGQILTVPPKGAGVSDTEAKVLLGKMGNAWDLEPLPAGNFLVTHYTDNKVVEYDSKGKKLWSFADLKSPLDADRLPNGNTLISDTYGSRVIEVNAAGKVVWEYKNCKQPYDADRLPDGNTLISEYRQRVIEVDKDGKVVWEYKHGDAFGADRLRNGHTLITGYGGEVIELDQQKNVFLRLKNLRNPNEARRMPNGNTIVAENNRIREFDRAGKVVRTIPLETRPGTLHVR